jgi:peroxiredoxin
MLADGNADYTKELGLLLDVSGFGMGLRSQRYAMVVEDSKVLYLGVDPEGVDKSSVESVLKFLQ